MHQTVEHIRPFLVRRFMGEAARARHGEIDDQDIDVAGLGDESDAASGGRRSRLSAKTAAPSSRKRSTTAGPMKSADWVTTTRLPDNLAAM